MLYISLILLRLQLTLFANKEAWHLLKFVPSCLMSILVLHTTTIVAITHYSTEFVTTGKDTMFDIRVVVQEWM